MSEYTPIALRHDGYSAGHADGVHCMGSVHCHWRGDSVEAWQEHRDEIERAIAQVRREAKAAAIRDAATELLALDPVGDAVMWDGQGYERVYDWLLDRANQAEGENK